MHRDYQRPSETVLSDRNYRERDVGNHRRDRERPKPAEADEQQSYADLFHVDVLYVMANPP